MSSLPNVMQAQCATTGNIDAAPSICLSSSIGPRLTLTTIYYSLSDMMASGPNPQVRFIVACPRSGSTLLMRIFAEAPQCAVTSRLVLMGNHGKTTEFVPNYAIFSDPTAVKAYQEAVGDRKLFLVNKEELGNNTRKGECSYDVFSGSKDYDAVKPVFLVRDPVRVFDSWKNVGWMDMQSLFDCYDNIFRMQKEAPNAPCQLVYEKLVHNKSAQIARVCDWWDMSFSDDLLDFKKDFGDFTFNSDREQQIYQKDKPLGLFRTVEAHSTVKSDIKSHGHLSNEEKYQIECRVGRTYMGCWQPEVEELRASLAEKAVFAFDLDDTLHEFRKASGAAVSATLSAMQREIPSLHGLSVADLKAQYASVLVDKTASAFVDGKTSHENRKTRFTALLTAFSVVATDAQMDSFLAVYEETLTANLELKCGALDVLKTVKALGKKTVIITEGPEDAQVRTVDALGLTPYIDHLVTTGKFGVSKTTGLYKKVLEHLHISAADIVMVGDNFARDMVPAVELGILAVHYAESENFSLDTETVKINTLKKLEFIVSAAED
jgi:HAD superfamily hydrolase (TIGR01549 family)